MVKMKRGAKWTETWNWTISSVVWTEKVQYQEQQWYFRVPNGIKQKTSCECCYSKLPVYSTVDHWAIAAPIPRLTPNDSLHSENHSYIPKGTFPEAYPPERFRYVQRMTNLFWEMWRRGYLLIERKKWKFPKRNEKKNGYGRPRCQSWNRTSQEENG